LDTYSAAHISSIDQLNLLLAIVLQGGALLLVLLLLFLLLSFSIAGIEAAFFSLQKKDLDVLRTKQHAEARRIVRLMSHPKELHASLLIAGTMVNSCIVIVLNYALNQPLKQWLGRGSTTHWFLSLLVIGLIVVVLYVFVRLLPRLWARQQPIRFAHDFVFIAAGLHYLLLRPSRLMLRLVDKAGHKTEADSDDRKGSHQIDDSVHGESDKAVSANEKMIMSSVVNFRNRTVRQIMRNRLEVSGIDYESPMSVVLRQVAELHYSRLPVYRGDLDQVVGILNTKDLLPYVQSGDGFDWHRLLRTPFMVPEPKPIEELLKEFQQKRIHFAIVVDEFGGTSGIVTMEDILEEVIGDIRDEFDEE
jgi:CBS domain containing-hemolysin-like protein